MGWVSPVNIIPIFRIPFPKNTYGGLLLNSTVINFWELEKNKRDIDINSSHKDL